MDRDSPVEDTYLMPGSQGVLRQEFPNVLARTGATCTKESLPTTMGQMGASTGRVDIHLGL
jgi:hypothetical protein